MNKLKQSIEETATTIELDIIKHLEECKHDITGLINMESVTERAIELAEEKIDDILEDIADQRYQQRKEEGN